MMGFWTGLSIGLLIGLVAGNVGALGVMMFMAGSSERMTYEEWEARETP